MKMIVGISKTCDNRIPYMCVNIQEFSKNLQNIKGNSFSFGFGIEEFLSEQAI